LVPGGSRLVSEGVSDSVLENFRVSDQGLGSDSSQDVAETVKHAMTGPAGRYKYSIVGSTCIRWTV
jgi:hypothetical protein